MGFLSEEAASSSSQVIPAGTKVFFRWTDRMAKNSHNEIKLLDKKQLVEIDLEAALNDQDDALVNHLATHHSSPTIPGLLLLLIVALVFIASLFLIRLARAVCCRSELDDDEEEDLEHCKRADHGSRRALQVVLVPKGAHKNPQRYSVRRKSTSSLYSMVHPFEGSNERKLTTMSMLHDGSSSALLKPFPRRIYELQAEEGYFSCPPSMRASFDLDPRDS